MAAAPPVSALECRYAAFSADTSPSQNEYAIFRDDHSLLLNLCFSMSYNLIILRRSTCIVYFLRRAVCQTAVAQQPETDHTSQILLMMPFENNSAKAGLDWIGEAFPEVLSSRFKSGSLYLVERDDRLNAFDRLGIPATARPSRATVYQVAQELDADYVLIGSFNFDGTTLTAHARMMDVPHLRLGPELTESGPLPNLVTIQTALAWDLLNSLKLSGDISKEQFVAQFPAIRLAALENYLRGVLATAAPEKIKRFQEALRLDPKNTLAMLQLGKAYYANRNYNDAVATFSKVPPGDPSANEAQFFLGLSAFYADQMDKAENAFRALSARLPLTEVFNNLGVVTARRGQKRARAYFEKSVQTDPSDPDYHFNLAVELYREGDAQSAARELKTVALQGDSEAKTFLDTIASGSQVQRMPLERIKRNYDESGFRQISLEIANADEARLRKSSPAEHAAFHVQRGQDMLAEGLTSEAEKQFREAISLDGTNAFAHSGLAQVLEITHNFEGARKEAGDSLRIKPSASALLVLARLALTENNASDAEKNVDQALAIDPANAAAVALKHDLAARSVARPH
jgi:tetratricopeptide (TPR) repeat protein/TolB-like protein